MPGAAFVCGRFVGALLVAAVAACMVAAAPANAGPMLNPCLQHPPPDTYCGVITMQNGTGSWVGNGDGTFVSDPAGIDCTFEGTAGSGMCTSAFRWPTTFGNSIQITIIESPAVGSEVCYKSCALNGGSTLPRSFTETLDAGERDLMGLSDFTLPVQTLSVSKSGTGTGLVTSVPVGIACGSVCSAGFDYSSTVAVAATADQGSVFKQWTGACAGQGAVCKLTIGFAQSTTAVFDLVSSGGSGGDGTGPPPDTTLDAQFVAATIGKSKIGTRLVNVEIQADEPIAVELTLIRGSATLAHKHLARYDKDDGVVALAVPRAVTKGKATLTITLTDAAGNTETLTRTISIPKKPTLKRG